MNPATKRRLEYIQRAMQRKPSLMDRPMATALNPRRLFFWALIGANRTGKTSTLIQMVKAWRRANPGKRVIAYDPQFILQRAGLVDIVINAHLKDWPKILCQINGPQFKGMGGAKEFKYGDSLIVLDDFRGLHPQHQMRTDLLELFGQRTLMNIDIFYCVWNPINLLDQMCGFTNRYSIFYTMSQQGGFSDKIPNYVPCQKCAVMINKYVSYYQLLEKGGELYPHFPYFLVRDDYETRAEAVNIDEKKLLAVIKQAA